MRNLEPSSSRLFPASFRVRGSRSDGRRRPKRASGPISRLPFPRLAPRMVCRPTCSETRNAVAKHELIEIIRTTKDRVRLRDALLVSGSDA